MKRRVLVLLSVVVLMVVMLAMGVAPALASPPLLPGSPHSAPGANGWLNSIAHSGGHTCTAYDAIGVNAPPCL